MIDKICIIFQFDQMRKQSKLNDLFINCELFIESSFLKIFFITIMDNYAILEGINISFTEQNSWMNILKNQIDRNFNLFKLYEIDKFNKKSTQNPKNLHQKITSDIKILIKKKLQKRKISDQLPLLNVKPSITIRLRRKTEEQRTKCEKNGLPRNSLNSPSFLKSKNFKEQLNIEMLRNDLKEKDISNKSNFLPFFSSKKFDQNQKHARISPKIPFQSKIGQQKFPPIVSLHEVLKQIELKRKKSIKLSNNLNFLKRMTHMEKYLIRSTLNSQKKPLGSRKQESLSKKLKSQLLPTIIKLVSRKVYIKESREKRNQIQNQQQQTFNNSSKKTQETKGSESSKTLGLDSIQEFFQAWKLKQKAFEDNHINKSNSFSKYRVQKIKNIRYPII